MEQKLRYAIISIIVMLFAIPVFSQTDSTANNAAADDMLAQLEQQQDTTPALLPEHMLFTQRILWGQHGLMRHTSAFELTPDNRDKELRLRRKFLVAHQILGGITLAQMVGQGIVGSMLYTGNRNVRDIHEGLATGINITYFSTAALAFFAPPKMMSERKGVSSIKIHKVLACVHLTAMIATNILADQIQGNPSIKPYHRAAAFTAFGSFAAAMFVIKF